MISPWIWMVLLAVSAVLGAYAARRAHARGRREAGLEALAQTGALEEKASRIPELLEEIRLLRERAEREARESGEIGRSNERLQTELRELRAREPEMRGALRAELSQLAAKFLDEKGREFTGQNKIAVEAVLLPLRERIEAFERKVENSHKEGAVQHAQLKTQIEILHQMNQNLGQEARNLTTALKGENKKGGNWGEVVLERVLESSGLEKDREYRIQPTFAGEQGSLRPDVVIDLPDNRHLVIDSKLSLVAYERYCAAETPEAADIELAAHIQSVRQHVEALSAKRYQEIHALNSVDFVFLFMPVEPAFIEASKKDPSLFQAAFAKNIVIVSPSTLLATLRTVASIWKQENQNRNVREIARQAVALYEKFVGFLADLDKIGKALAAGQESFNEARAKLSQGKGNLVSRVESLRKLGAKSGKQIPAAWREDEEDAPLPDPDLLPPS